MSRFKFFFASLVLLAAFTLPSNSHATTGDGDTNQIVVMISVDGLAADYLDDPKAEMPNIRALAAAGARAKSMKASNPTVTWPNHTTLVTGVNPARHGVVGNNYYDRALKKKITLILDPIYDKDEIVKVPTIYDAAKSKGLRTAAVIWPATRNAKSLDWTVPESGLQAILEKYTTPALMEECEQNGISLPKEIYITPTRRRYDSTADDVFVRTFNLILQKNRPQLALLHIIAVDHTEHEKGPRTPAAYEAVKIADAQVGKVWKELQKDYPNKATLLVVSDHGFSPIKHIILPNVVLRQAGLVQVEGKKIVSGSVQLVVQGGCAMLYVLDQEDRNDVIKKVKKAFRNVHGISKVVGPDKLKDYGVANPKDDPNAPDMLIFADFGYTLGDTAAGELAFDDKPERFGSHGHDASLPGLHATFVAWGEGIKPGARLGEISNLDVAPTIAKLLKISFPSADGQPLQKILK
jgi:predicted AlkP superfamily pyrophosphatase or phosphodiesterase